MSVSSFTTDNSGAYGDADRFMPGSLAPLSEQGDDGVDAAERNGSIASAESGRTPSDRSPVVSSGGSGLQSDAIQRSAQQSSHEKVSAWLANQPDANDAAREKTAAREERWTAQGGKLLEQARTASYAADLRRQDVEKMAQSGNLRQLRKALAESKGSAFALQRAAHLPSYIDPRTRQNIEALRAEAGSVHDSLVARKSELKTLARGNASYTERFLDVMTRAKSKVSTTLQTAGNRIRPMLR